MDKEIYIRSMKESKIKLDLIINELLHKLNTLEFNKGHGNKYKNKQIKHHPKRHTLSFDDIIKLRQKNYRRPSVSMSLLNKNHEDLIQYITKTIKRRINMFMFHYNSMYHSNIIIHKLIQNGLDCVNDILKFDKDEIVTNFPDLVGTNGRSMFDVVYSIRTENIHHFILSNNDKFFMCEYILICFTGNKYNILFHSDNVFELTKEQFNYLYDKVN